MPTLVLIRRLMQHPLGAPLAMLICAIAAKSGTLTLSLAYLGAVATFVLTRALAASIARTRHYA